LKNKQLIETHRLERRGVGHKKVANNTRRKYGNQLNIEGIKTVEYE
jgi:hypothetical protein